MNQVISKHHKTFAQLRQHTDEGDEFWSARELYPVLGYSRWDRFKGVIKKSVTSCNNSGIQATDHFSKVGKMVTIGSNAERYIEDYDYQLSRYACYLIVQNGDPSKLEIAHGQTYFAIQTRRQELADDADFQRLGEDRKRVFLRNELKEHNKQLGATANQAGVETHLDFAIFQDHGYKGLYGGLGARDIHQKKKLKRSQKILDHMGSAELAANLFRATQAEEKLRRNQVSTKAEANVTHYEVGSKVRQTIKDLGGTMPEDLSTPERSVKALEKQQQKKLDKM